MESTATPKGRGRPKLSEKAKALAEGIAYRIRQARLARGMAILDCAKALKITQGQYEYLERVCSTRQAELYLTSLSQLFGVSPNVLRGLSAPFDLSGTWSTGDGLKNFVDAENLARRARERRDELGLSRQVVADLIGIDAAMFLGWERRLPRLRRDEEGCWEKILHAPVGWLRDPSLKPFPSPAYPHVEDADRRTVVDDIRDVCCWFARKSPHRRHLIYADLNDQEQRLVDIMVRRYGIAGEAGSTLQAIANQVGLTRERVRQLCDDFSANVDVTPVSTPALDRLTAEIQSRIPARVGDLEDELASLLGGALTIAAADRFARQVLGRSVANITTTPGNVHGLFIPMVVPAESQAINEVRQVRHVVLQMVRNCGAAQLHFVAGMASKQLGKALSPDEVLTASKMFGSFEWLSEEDGWFWFGPAGENRAKTCAFKVLSVASRNVDVEEIHDALSRARTVRSDPNKPRPFLIDAPVAILTEVLARIPGVERLQYNDFRLIHPIDPEQVLSGAESAIRRVLLTHGGVCTRHVLTQELAETGDMLLITLNMSLDTSPIFMRLDKGVWSLRANGLDPKALAKALLNGSGLGRQKFALYSADPVDGAWRLAVTVPESAFRRSHWLVPSALRDILTEGEYHIDGFEEPVLYVAEDVNPNLRRFISKLKDIGIGPEKEFILVVEPEGRRLKVEPLTLESGLGSS